MNSALNLCDMDVIQAIQSCHGPPASYVPGTSSPIISATSVPWSVMCYDNINQTCTIWLALEN